MDMILNQTTLILLFIAVYAVDVISSFLNVKTSEGPLPAHLQDLQTREAQQKASQYLKDRIWLGTLKDGFFLVLMIALFKFDFFDQLGRFAHAHANGYLGEAFIFAGVLLFGQGILGLPFSIYSTFKIEAHYGFNRTTPGTFAGDLVKGTLVGAILGGLIFAFIAKMVFSFGSHAWLMMWIGYSVFQFFIVWIAPVTILPLFMKLSPLAEGPLRSEIEDYSKKQSFTLNGVWTCDASKRSAKSNAFFTGFGRFRRLVLFDTLIEKHPPAEIVAIVAHEAGHFKLGHIWKTSILSAVSSLVFFYVTQQLIDSAPLYQAFQMQVANPAIGLILAGIVLTKLLFFFSPIRSYFSRVNEYAADRFSVETTGDAPSLVSGLKRLVTENLATLQHHPLYVILNDSHPPLPDRLKPWLK
jgi:STE24 endopeptidase